MSRNEDISKKIKLRAIGLLAVIACALLAGCGDRAERMDERDTRHPLMKRARQKAEAGKKEDAIALYREALSDRPDLARAHLELGLLFDKPEGDKSLRAIYHYERYLEKRPSTEKRDIVEGLIMGAQMSYAASLPDKPSAAVRKIAELTKENRLLKRRLAAIEGKEVSNTAQRTPRRSQTETSPEFDTGAFDVPSPAPAEDAVEFYEVKRNDTLTRIANKIYNDPNKWQLIYEANRKALKSPESLRLGQKLVIPDLPE